MLGGAAEIHRRSIEALGVKATCSVADLVAEITSRERADSTAMKFAMYYKFFNKPRASEYLAHYLNGSGTDKAFPLADLLKEDAGIAATVKEHFDRARRSRAEMSRPLMIVISQNRYKSKDWWGALGSFRIFYEPMGRTGLSSAQPDVVWAWGSDIYQWHPEDQKRITQCLHQAAVRLSNSQNPSIPRAKAFQVKATPCAIDTRTGLPVPGRRLLTAQPMKGPSVPVPGPQALPSFMFLGP